MSLQGVLPFVLDFFPKKLVEFEISSAQKSSDAGILPIALFDETKEVMLIDRNASVSTARGKRSTFRSRA